MEPVKNFNPEKYLGTWNELLRYKSFFEKDDVRAATANYSLNDDGTIKVINTSYSNNGESSIEGFAVLVEGHEDEGRLLVCFYENSYSEYKIIMLDEEYKISVVTNAEGTLLWILSRETKIHLNLMVKLCLMLVKMGFDENKFVFNYDVVYS